MPLVSVIIPTYNRAAVIGRAIQSVLIQSFTDYELIVVDDGSTDETGSLSIITDNKKQVRFIRLDQNYGVSKARNTGVSESSGSLIAFLDSDDEWKKEKLKEQVAWLRDNDDFKIVQSREIWIRSGKRVNPPATHEKRGGDIFRESLERCMITPSSVLMEKSLFRAMGGFNESLPACEDYDLWLRITCRYPIGLIDAYHLTRYGGHEDQLSSRIPMLDKFRIRALMDLISMGILNSEQDRLAREMLWKKTHIVANGYEKRGNKDLHEQYNTIAGRFGRKAP
jgi:glycosyltransferase involved in cell wall biosynthesis